MWRVAFFFLIACLGFTGGALAKSRPLLPAEQRIVESVMKDRMNDPDSAKFQILPFNGSKLVCGKVNAKNLMGGYVGYRVFDVEVTVGAKGRITGAQIPNIYNLDDDEESLEIMAAGSCDEAGYKVPDPRGPSYDK